MPKLSDREILAAIDDQASKAYGEDASLQNERAEALDYYLGRPYGNEVEGRSQVVTRDVLETVEWILPSLMRIFTSGDKVVEFIPQGLEDEAAADQETDVLNYVVLQQNDSFMNFFTWFKDALLSKTAYVKIYYDTQDTTTTETYQGLSEEELQFLAAGEVEILGIEQNQMDGTYSVKVKRAEKVGKICFDPVPGEEIRVSQRVRGYSLKSADYVEHRTMMTISEIRQMGYDVEDDIADGTVDHDNDQLTISRDQYNEREWNDDHADPAMREVLFRDVTIRIDVDGDGVAELMRYYVVGSKILDSFEAENVYYACLGPVPMPHRHVGLSVADLIMDLQKIRSTILRQYIDNLYLQNNGRYAISDRVNLDDMLVSRPGGVVRVEGMPGEGHIMPLVHPSNGQAAIQGLEYIDTQKENRTGVTKYNQGLDSNSLNKTMGGISQIMNAAQQRIELIARIFAETGVKDMFLLVHELLKKHQDKQMVIKLRHQYIHVDPRQWKTRTDMSVSVGLGTGNKDQQLQHLVTIMQIQREGIQIGITDPTLIYNAAKKIAENAGFKSGDEFFKYPEPQQAQPNPQQMAMQAELQMKQQSAQIDAAAKQQKTQADIEAMHVKLQADIQMAQQKLEADIQLAREKMMADIQLEREKLAASASMGVM